MSFRPEGYPENWVDGHTICYLKNNVIVNMIALNPADGLEAQFSNDYGAETWVYVCDAWANGATTPPSMGYTYDGTNFIAPSQE